MKTIEQLGTTSTGDISPLIPELWIEEVEEAARAKRVTRDYVRVNEDLKQGGDILHFPKRKALTASSVTESESISPSTMDYTEITLEPTEYAVGVTLKKKAIRESQVDLISDANRELGEAIGDQEDTFLLGTSVFASGTANQVGSVAALTPAKVQEMANEVRKDDFDPDVVFMAPEQHYQLATNDQFTDAAKLGDFGERDGMIERFMGLDIVVTTNVATADYGGGTAGHYVVAADSGRAAVLAIGAETELETEYKPMDREHKIAAVTEFDGNLLNDDATANLVVKD